MGDDKLQHSPGRGGTLAIDLGSTTTVVAFQSPDTPTAQLVELSPISRRPGEVPSLVWQSGEQLLIGRQVIEAGLDDSNDPRLHRDFKRLIGPQETPEHNRACWAGQQLLQRGVAKASPKISTSNGLCFRLQWRAIVLIEAGSFRASDALAVQRNCLG